LPEGKCGGSGRWRDLLQLCHGEETQHSIVSHTAQAAQTLDGKFSPTQSVYDWDLLMGNIDAPAIILTLLLFAQRIADWLGVRKNRVS
jgi:hypothetical protein